MTSELCTAGKERFVRLGLMACIAPISVVLLAIWLLVACSVKPGQGPVGGSDVVSPLWLDQTTGSTSADTAHCKNLIALLIGISQYDPANGWESLNAQNDVSLLTQTLRRRGVPANHIHVLQDHQATKAGIVRALNRLADTLQPGSQLLILYAGHARQLPDNNGDEKDQYDEAIVPYDAPPANRPDPIGYLRDDELNNYLTAIRNTLGSTGSLWLLFDSCHSKTLNRGNLTLRTRGGVAPMGPTLTRRIRPDLGSDWYETPPGSQKMAPYVLFSAATDGGESYETVDASGRSFGPLTRAFCEAWGDTRFAETYRTLFARLSVVMARYAPYQQPGQEGDLDVSVSGCASGSSANISRYRTVGEPVRIAWPHQDVALTNALTSLPFVTVAGANPDLHLVRRNRGYRLLVGANSRPLAEHLLSAYDCAEKIRQYFSRNVVLQLQQTSPDFQIQTTMKRLAVQMENGRTVVTDTLPALPTTGLPSFRVLPSERVLLSLTNTGKKPFYLTVVDLPSDGSLHVLLPETGHTSTEYQLAPGQSLHRRIRITEPTGVEVYKLLLTPDPVDLRSILQTRGSYVAKHPYELIFQRIYSTRGAADMAHVKLSDKAGATADVAFWVEK